ncbi:MAG: hypothetical protein OMM_14378 [Candidatus Magnetoglobus multicellularis str. Araruama]|uniref:Putative zinc-finger domain-containing protein n=1 Tax=Candidatus Magnetoglobus multicellularis str. Araruama TaxID=890399 RepID=A0A1V1NS08_9BACT|nr:MAG: hypothetical protein OMM_14378 [Candidatus Magnetoglobus multicellularis str. Araruama]
MKCITIDQLIGYLNQTISSKEREIVEHHLARCDTCLEMVDMTAQLVNETFELEWETSSESKAKESWKKIKKQLKDFYQWLKDQSPPLWINPTFQPALTPVYVRSEDESRHTDGKAIYIKRHINHLWVELFLNKTMMI